MPKAPSASDLAKEIAIKLAKEVAKQAAKTAATAVAPWVGLGCLIIVGIIIAIFLFSAITIMTLYGLCDYAPHTVGWILWWNNMGDLCATIMK
jgi:hypothetical protein